MTALEGDINMADALVANSVDPDAELFNILQNKSLIRKIECRIFSNKKDSEIILMN